ncbi:hypothetical protein GGI24_005926, partial [Coemansia furcata]
AKAKDAPKKKRSGISARRAHNPAAPAAEAAAVVPSAELSDDEPINDEDMEFVRENAKSLSFLSSVNPEKLAKIEKQAKTKGMKNRDKPKVAAPAELSETEDEAGSDDDEDMGIVAEDSDSDLEVYSDDDEVNDVVVSESEAESMGEAESMDEEDEYEFRNSKSRRVQKRKAMMDGAMSYEQGTRTFEQTEKRPKVSNRLPIKTADGRLVVSDAESEQEEAGEESDVAEDDKMDVSEEEEEDLAESESESEDEDESEGAPSAAPKAKAAKKTTDDGATDFSVEPDREQLTRKEYIVAQQNRLAGLADMIMQNPERGSKAYKLLHAISEDSDVRVKRLGLLTQLGVYCDVLPDYRIRELTEKEKQMKVTKDVRQQRMHEEALVSNYGAYLRQLFAAAKSAMKVFGDAAADVETGAVAARALGELVNAHPHFNFRRDILAALVDIYVQPSSRIALPGFAPMAQTARLAVLRLFRDDVSGEYSQNAVLLASKRIKRLSYR